MKRRSFVQGAAAAAVLGVPHLSGLAQQSVMLKFHTFMAPLSNVWLTMHKPWMDKVDKDSGGDRKSTRLNSSHLRLSRMPSSA